MSGTIPRAVTGALDTFIAAGERRRKPKPKRQPEPEPEAQARAVSPEVARWERQRAAERAARAHERTLRALAVARERDPMLTLEEFEATKGKSQ